jgi:hypothetical protein
MAAPVVDSLYAKVSGAWKQAEVWVKAGGAYSRAESVSVLESAVDDDAVLPFWGAPVWRDEFDYTDPSTGQPRTDPSKWNVRDSEGWAEDPAFGELGFDRGSIQHTQITVDASQVCHLRGTWRPAAKVLNGANSLTGTFSASDDRVTFSGAHGIGGTSLSNQYEYYYVDVVSGSPGITSGYYYVRSIPTSTAVTLTATMTPTLAGGTDGGVPGSAVNITGTGTCRFYKHLWMDSAYMDQRLLRAGDVQPVAQVYGRWEIKAKVPVDVDIHRGTLAGFWLRNTSSGEIDIMEGWGGAGEGDKMFPWTTSVTHFPDTSSTAGKVFSRYETGPDTTLATAWHTWAYERTPTYIRAYKDGDLRAEWTRAAYPQLWGATFEAPYHLRVSLHIGPSSRWFGVPLTDHPEWSQEMDYAIDHIRVWAWPG